MNKIIGIPIKIRGTNLFCACFKENGDEALCIYKGNPEEFSTTDVLVRIQSGCVTSEVFGIDICDCKWQLDKSIEEISTAVAGIIIYFPSHEGKGNGLFNKIRSFEVMNLGINSSDAYEILGLPSDTRQFDFAVTILKTFGVKKIKLLTNSPSKVIACLDGGLIISERIPLVMNKPNPAIKQLLENKKKHFNHFIN